jgi:uncharacterized membrane protein
MHSDASPRFREIAADALRYWELRRIVYNLALTGVVAAHFFAAWPASRSFLGWNTLFVLIFLAVLANVCYCAVYVVDVFVQFSGLREEWAQWRWALLLVGTIFGAVIAHFFCGGVFSEPWTD